MNQHWYTTADLAEALHCSERQICKFRKNGLIEGIRTSKGYVFHELEIDRFWQTFRGCDLSSEDKMQLAYKKRAANRGK